MIPPAAAVAGIETVEEDRFEPDAEAEPEAEREPDAGAWEDDIVDRARILRRDYRGEPGSGCLNRCDEL